MTKFFQGSNDPKSQVSNMKKIQAQIAQMSGVIQYKNPKTCIFQEGEQATKSEILEIVGYLKLANDPKLDLIKEENMLYKGSQLNNSWVFGLVLYTGISTKQLRESEGKFSTKNILQNKNSVLSEFQNTISLVIIVISIFVAFVSNITTTTSVSDQGVMESLYFPSIGSFKRFLLYFVDTSTSLCYFLPTVISLTNLLQYWEVRKYN